MRKAGRDCLHILSAAKGVGGWVVVVVVKRGPKVHNLADIICEQKYSAKSNFQTRTWKGFPALMFFCQQQPTKESNIPVPDLRKEVCVHLGMFSMSFASYETQTSIVCESLTMRADLKCVPVEIKMPPARLWIGRGGYKVGREQLGVAVKRFLLKEPRKGVEALGKNFGVERGQYWAVTPFKEKIVIYKQYHYSVKSS